MGLLAQLFLICHWQKTTQVPEHPVNEKVYEENLVLSAETSLQQMCVAAVEIPSLFGEEAVENTSFKEKQAKLVEVLMEESETSIIYEDLSNYSSHDDEKNETNNVSYSSMTSVEKDKNKAKDDLPPSTNDENSFKDD